MSSTSTLDNIDYMVIVLNAKPMSLEHITDTINFYEFYEDNYGYVNVVDINDLFYTLKVKDSKEKEYEIRAKEDVLKYLKKDTTKAEFIIEYKGVEEINNKFKKGDLLGSITISYEDEILYVTKVYLDKDIKFYNYTLWNICVVTSFIALLAIIILIIKKSKK